MGVKLIKIQNNVKIWIDIITLFSDHWTVAALLTLVVSPKWILLVVMRKNLCTLKTL